MLNSNNILQTVRLLTMDSYLRWRGKEARRCFTDLHSSNPANSPICEKNTTHKDVSAVDGNDAWRAWAYTDGVVMRGSWVDIYEASSECCTTLWSALLWALYSGTTCCGWTVCWCGVIGVSLCCTLGVIVVCDGAFYAPHHLKRLVRVLVLLAYCQL